MAKRPKSELTAIPGIGENMAAHLNALGIEHIGDLKGMRTVCISPGGGLCRGADPEPGAAQMVELEGLTATVNGHIV